MTRAALIALSLLMLRYRRMAYAEAAAADAIQQQLEQLRARF